MRTLFGVFVVASFLFSGCKSKCDRALDHVVKLAYAEMVAEAEKVPNAEQVKKTLPSESDMDATTRKIAARRFEGRCGDEAFLDCELAAKTSLETQRCNALPH
jgi:hypothetical protein